MTKGAKKSVRRWISALVSSRSSITIMGDSMLSLQQVQVRHIDLNCTEQLSAGIWTLIRQEEHFSS